MSSVWILANVYQNDIASVHVGDAVTIDNETYPGAIRGKNPKFNWLDWSEAEFKGTFIAYPERESVPENIKEQLIVELYSK